MLLLPQLAGLAPKSIQQTESETQEEPQKHSNLSGKIDRDQFTSNTFDDLSSTTRWTSYPYRHPEVRFQGSASATWMPYNPGYSHVEASLHPQVQYMKLPSHHWLAAYEPLVKKNGQLGLLFPYGNRTHFPNRQHDHPSSDEALQKFDAHLRGVDALNW